MACYYYQQKRGDIVYAPFADAPKLPRHKRPKCGAKTRKGTPCQAPPGSVRILLSMDLNSKTKLITIHK